MTNKKKTTNQTGDWQKEEEIVQAVIIADSFNRKFAPITYETPRALLSLGNKVLIDYAIEYLIAEEIQEIIVFCCSFGEKIRDYINEKWTKKTSHCLIHCIMSSTSDCISLGDALREIDREGLIRSDFILLPGDLLSNIKLSSIIKEHRAKRKKEKTLVMTNLYKKMEPGHFSRCPEEDVVMAIESDTNKLLYIQKSNCCKNLLLPMSLLNNEKEVCIRYDLAATHISICSPQVAPLFTDNFDYQNLDDFVRGVLINEEIMGDQVCIEVMNEGYSSRINDLHMYNAVSMDLLNRWIYPLVPDIFFSCTFKRNNVYLEKDVRIERNCDISNSVLIGKSTTVGESTKITRSCIGSNCKIGSNVTIINSYIWDDVVIKDNAVINQTLICNNCCINKSVSLTDSIISFGVCVGEGITLVERTRLSLIKPENIGIHLEKLDLNKQCNYDKEVGTDGKGFLWPRHEDNDEEDANVPSLAGNVFESTDEESSEEDDEESLPPSPPNEQNNFHQFYVEVVENLRCGVMENIAADNISLEINASKFKFNISIPELYEAVIKGLLELSIIEGSKQESLVALEKNITCLRPLLLKYFNSDESQMNAVSVAESFFATMLNMGGLFPTFLHKMYDKDIIDEVVILRWYKKPPFTEEFTLQDNYNQLRQNPTLVKFITWLNEADEEDSDEESD
ncbi:translation initiation factor eIF2B subunit epsilon isoform X1 [Hydra vulgaris]|uniref:translation initiation factor eIF2B subunit epsilon isoform X1 n=1 Tax=Hydra vulgaris TaxID=6087 RepID=UPI001F5F3566|nr:translation initiation factor eIF-2B subunit epsilon [Hydra vulgaris]